MRHITGLVVSLTIAGSLTAAPPDPAKFGWETDYVAARAKAKRNGKPLLVVFRCQP